MTKMGHLTQQQHLLHPWQSVRYCISSCPDLHYATNSIFSFLNPTGTPTAGSGRSPSVGGPPTSEPNKDNPASTVSNAIPSNVTSTSAASTQFPQTLSGPGLLLIKILETRKLMMPDGSSVQLSGSTGKDDGLLPFAIIEMDKMEVLAKAIDGNSSTTLANWQSRANFDISRPCEATISIYVPGPNRSEVMIGLVRIKPTFVDQKLEEHWFPLVSMNGSDKPESIGEIRVQFVFRVAKNKHLAVEDFELLKVIGKGSFGKVMQVRKKDTGRTYAMKIIKKAHIVERDEVSHTLAERNVLTKLQHPFIVPLKYSFQSSEKLYLVLAFVNGGELFHHLQQEGKFSEDRAKFYTAELLCALECLHGLNIIYR
ncbi:hypothetical protein BDEG_24667 [Batrachochytrium dendrobatidis JEL423]|uniref:non-specific serine/threonine protein kinase n=1 Tax=Batrachochytrium dendrobatidis (strain JEL423) TaxID=403673 RepID=A0A177WNS1_BATDL|nr:hypothetical protein BDEG_24667 [Batrachochytrium dendrobatidis JEL423]